jgi:hypothetical protein
VQLIFIALSQQQHYKVLLSPYLEPEKPSQQSLDDEAAMMMKLDHEYKKNPPKNQNWFSWKGEAVTSGACDDEKSD